MKPVVYFFLLSLFIPAVLMSQNDSLILINGDNIVGELKSLDRGVVTIETDYSDNDFKIEWNGIKEIYSNSFFLITLSNGKRINGNFKTTAKDQITITSYKGETTVVKPQEMVYFKSVDKGFWDRVYATIDVGFDLAKANNLKTFSTWSTLGYLANRWSLDINFSTMFSFQDSTDAIRRTEGGISYKYYLPRDWYLPVTATYLSNTEQKLDARWNGMLGIGKYIIHSNHAYWGFSAGASFNNEKYSPSDEPATNTNSWEGFVGTELNLFDMGDLSLVTTAKVFPGITEAGRWRVDFNFDMKYDLPLDFYIKLGCSLNYDNRPVAGASETDYVLHTGFGWEW